MNNFHLNFQQQGADAICIPGIFEKFPGVSTVSRKASSLSSSSPAPRAVKKQRMADHVFDPDRVDRFGTGDGPFRSYAVYLQEKDREEDADKSSSSAPSPASEEVREIYKQESIRRSTKSSPLPLLPETLGRERLASSKLQPRVNLPFKGRSIGYIPPIPQRRVVVSPQA